MIKYHMQQLEEAQIDFINGVVDSLMNDSEVLCETALEMRKSGIETPGIVFLSRTTEEARSDDGSKIYDRFYKSSKYDELIVYWNHKPFLLIIDYQIDIFDNRLEDYFACREMRGLQSSSLSREWSFLQDKHQNVAISGSMAEQISVTVVHQESYMSSPTATTGNDGKTFQKQWRRVFSVKPEVVTIT